MVWIHFWLIYEEFFKEPSKRFFLSFSCTAVITNISDYLFINDSSNNKKNNTFKHDTVDALCKSPAKRSPLHTQVRTRYRHTTFWPVSLSPVMPGLMRAPRWDICAKVKQVLICIGNTWDPWAFCVLNERTPRTNKCICLIKALWIFYAAACAGTETETGKKKQQLGCLSSALIGLLPSLRQTHRKSSILYVCRASLSEARGVIFSFSAINI